MNALTVETFDIPEPMAGRRRRFTVAEKRRFLSEAARPGETVSSVGRRYGLSVSLLFRWRRQLEGANARRTANRAGSGEIDGAGDNEALRQELLALREALDRSNAEVEQLRRRLSGQPAQAVAGLASQRLGGTVARDGEA